MCNQPITTMRITTSGGGRKPSPPDVATAMTPPEAGGSGGGLSDGNLMGMSGVLTVNATPGGNTRVPMNDIGKPRSGHTILEALREENEDSGNNDAGTLGGMKGRSKMKGWQMQKGEIVASRFGIKATPLEDDTEDMVFDSPCHQSMADEDMELRLMDGNDEIHLDGEEPTVVAPKDLKQYQMKLSIPTRNVMDSLIGIICRMMQQDMSMVLHTLDAMNKKGEKDNITFFEDLPEMEEEGKPYFWQVHDNKHQNGTSIICQVTLEYSHVKWQMLLKSAVMEQKLYIRVHKLDLMEMQIIGFMAQKHPEETHINRYKSYLKEKLPAGMPKFAIEWIYPKMTSRFDSMVKMDVLVKMDTGTVDEVMTQLLPPQPEGEYYVSFMGLDDEMKRKVYMHQTQFSLFKYSTTLISSMKLACTGIGHFMSL